MPTATSTIPEAPVVLAQGSFWGHIKSVDSGVFTRPVKKSGRTLSPEMVELAATIRLITDDTVVYEIPLSTVDVETSDENKKRLLNLRQMIVRASKHAKVETAIRRSESGYYVGLLTADRKWHRKSTPA